MGSEYGPRLRRCIGRGAATGGASVAFLSGMAAAQTATQWATDVCNLEAYQFFLGLGLVIVGVTFVADVVAAAASIGLLQLSFAQKLFAKMGRRGIIVSLVGIGLFILIIGVINLAAGAATVTSPDACTGPLM